MDAKPEWTVLARLERSRGNCGEMLASCFTSGPDRFDGLSVVLNGSAGPVDGGRRFVVENAWSHQGRLVLKLEGVDSISAAEALRGLDVCVPFEERAPLAEGEVYLSDLVGCEIVDNATGLAVGRVEGWQETAGPVLLEARDAHGREILVPFVKQICVSVDTAARVIRADLPEGLLELNAP